VGFYHEPSSGRRRLRRLSAVENSTNETRAGRSRDTIYKDLRDAVTMFGTEVRFSLEAQRKYMDARSRARFHFGAEVDRYLDEIRRAMIAGDLFDRFPQGHQKAVDQQVARLDQINAFYGEIDRMFVPHMRLDQRLPFWWWRKPLAKQIKG
jgi:hypothetical protein